MDFTLMVTTIHGLQVVREGIKAEVIGGLFGDPLSSIAAMASSGAAFSSAQAS
jgi:hypothetical protein